MNKSSTFLDYRLLLAAATMVTMAMPAQAQLVRCQGADGKITYRDLSSGPAGPNCRTVEERSSVIAPLPLPQAEKKAPPAKPPAKPPAPGQAVGAARVEDPAARLEEAEDQLEAARKALAQQEAVRYGDERNYQKVLDRLKPFQDEVDRRQQALEKLRKDAR